MSNIRSPERATMTEARGRYRVGPTDSAEPLLTTEGLVAAAHAHRQDIPDETGDPLLARLPDRLRALADLILGGQVHAGDVADAVAARIDGIEHAPGDAGRRWHGTEPTR